jgi:hypothetical protein
MQLAIANTTSFIHSLQVGTPQAHQGLAYMPLSLGTKGVQNPTQYLLGTQALRVNSISVTETDAVAQLDCFNCSALPVFFPAGTLLIGGAQDRMVESSLVVGSGHTGQLPVQCTQQNRWDTGIAANDDRSHFTSPERGSMGAHSLLAAATGEMGQTNTWQTIDQIAATTETATVTSRLADVFEQQLTRIDEYYSSIALPKVIDTQLVVGALFVIAGKTIADTQWFLDIFGRQDLMSGTEKALLEGAALAAIARKEQTDDVPRDQLHAAIKFAAQMASHVSAETLLHLPKVSIPVNRGELRRGAITLNTGEELMLSVLMDNNHPVHISARRVFN